MEGKILIADDEKLVRETLQLALEEKGFAAWAVSSASKAFPILEREDIDVIITDLRMPSMDGIQFQEKVRALWPDIEFIVITAFGSVATAVTAARGGASDYLMKPLDTEKLLRRVELLVKQKRDLGKIRHELAEDPD